jgi:hypothetical protein
MKTRQAELGNDYLNSRVRRTIGKHWTRVAVAMTTIGFGNGPRRSVYFIETKRRVWNGPCLGGFAMHRSMVVSTKQWRVGLTIQASEDFFLPEAEKNKTGRACLASAASVCRARLLIGPPHGLSRRLGGWPLSLSKKKTTTTDSFKQYFLSSSHLALASVCGHSFLRQRDRQLGC